MRPLRDKRCAASKRLAIACAFGLSSSAVSTSHRLVSLAVCSLLWPQPAHAEKVGTESEDEVRPDSDAPARSLGIAERENAGFPVEPWSDNDGISPMKRYAIGDVGFRGELEYRVNAALVAPLTVNGETDTKFQSWDQRLRLGGAVDYKDNTRVTLSLDALDGVLWGDNSTGAAGGPIPWSGANVNTKSVNVSRTCVVRWDERNSLSPNSYRYGLCNADAIYIRRLYMDVLTPIGLFRIGRQAFTEGAGVSVNDGNGRRNRFGYTNRGNSVDRILFATKPLEGFKPVAERNKSQTEGLFFFVAYDKLVQDEPNKFADDLSEVTTGLRFLSPNGPLGKNVELRGSYTYRWDQKYGTSINSVVMRAITQVGDFQAGVDASTVVGSTREVSDAFRLITSDPAVSQDIIQFGARAVVRYDRPAWTAYLEGDYASGDSDPTVRTPLTQMIWAEESNVGLLMFKKVMAYQSARAAAAANSVLQSLGATTFPTDAVDTRGAMANALAIFPQADYRPSPNWLFRGGVLAAWAPAPVNDPVQSQLAKRGPRIDNDLVNFNGGKSASFYGYEVDARIQYRFQEHFAFDLEGAVLFPGDAFQDVNGYAVTSYMGQARSTVFF